MGAAMMAVLRAVMTMDADDFRHATTLLEQAEALARTQSTYESTLSSLTRLLSGSQRPALTSERVHHTIMMGEARLLIGARCGPASAPRAATPARIRLTRPRRAAVLLAGVDLVVHPGRPAHSERVEGTPPTAAHRGRTAGVPH